MDSAKLVMPLLLIRTLLVLSGDVEVNPGPGKKGDFQSAPEFIAVVEEVFSVFDIHM